MLTQFYPIQNFQFSKFNNSKNKRNNQYKDEENDIIKKNISIIKAEHYRANYMPIFKGKIIDCHAHIGKWHDSNNQQITIESLKNALDINDKCNDNLSKVLISNLDCIDTIDHKPGSRYLSDEIQGNMKILEACKKNQDNRFIPLAVCQPGYGKAEIIDNLISRNKEFKGLKFHPYYINIDANDAIYDPYLKIAKKHKIPCVFHSAAGTSSPKKIAKLADRHPEVNIILYHMSLAGNNDEKKEAIEVVKSNKTNNLFLEVSWTQEDKIIEAIKEVGAEKVLFGTDVPLGPLIDSKNYADRIISVKQAIQENFPEDSEDIINKVFYENSKRIFKL